ncbi:MAG: hypothetical protein ACKVUS_20330 [Saprospiraceae bacterium]
MKKPSTFKASNSLLGTILILSLFGTAFMTSFDAFAELCTACKSQWYAFTESLSMMQPHRTVFPN